ncbi:MAG: energy transducer TonB [Bacteroidia bacterium]|nr:energy transducer TonB [Bacteroidia bacterium]
MKIATLIGLIFFCVDFFAQDVVQPDSIQSDSQKVIVVKKPVKDPCIVTAGSDTAYLMECTDQDPEFEGGTTAMYQYIGKKLKYPNEARALGIQGRVYISFFVNPDGTIGNVSLLKGINATAKDSTKQKEYTVAVEEMHSRAITVIKEMPNWKPGFKGGVAVRTRYVIPIMYRIQ